MWGVKLILWDLQLRVLVLLLLKPTNLIFAFYDSPLVSMLENVYIKIYIYMLNKINGSFCAINFILFNATDLNKLCCEM